MLVKRRHKFGCFLLRTISFVISKYKYNYKYETYKKKGPILLLGNHVMAHDPGLYSLVLKEEVYVLVANEMLRHGLTTKIMNYLLGPVPTSVGVKDTSSIKKLLSIAKEKKSIGIFPEGATTYCGELSYIEPNVAKLAKKINYDIVIVNVEGGFQSFPKFATKSRKGVLRSYIRKVITKEELQEMSTEELYDQIVTNLKVDLLKGVEYRYSKRAEYLENTIYYCHNCDSFKTYSSFKNNFKCNKCNTSYFVNKDLSIDGNVDSIAKLYHLQQDKINSLSLDDINNLVYEDNVKFIEVINNKKHTIYKGDLKLINSKFILGDIIIDLKDIKASCTTSSYMVDLYVGEKVYQLIGDKKFSALKYMNIIYRYINLSTNNNSKFLGI